MSAMTKGRHRSPFAGVPPVATRSRGTLCRAVLLPRRTKPPQRASGRLCRASGGLRIGNRRRRRPLLLASLGPGKPFASPFRSLARCCRNILFCRGRLYRSHRYDRSDFLRWSHRYRSDLLRRSYLRRRLLLRLLFLFRNRATLALDEFAALHRKNQVPPGGQADRHAPTRRHTVRPLKICLCAAQIHCVCRLVIRLCECRGGEHRDKACEQKLHQNFPYAYANGFALPRRNSKYQSPNARIMSVWKQGRHTDAIMSRSTDAGETDSRRLPSRERRPLSPTIVSRPRQNRFATRIGLERCKTSTVLSPAFGSSLDRIWTPARLRVRLE